MTDNTAENQLKSLRRSIVKMVYNANEGHIPSAFSILEILYVLYRDCLTFDASNPKWDDRDYLILSKGHAGAALYAVLAHFGFFPEETLWTYCKPGSPLGGHPDALKVPGVEVSSGSLGHGIAIAVGIAMGLKLKSSPRKVVVVVGDGEMDEGTFYESIMAIKNNNLTNIIVIADCNSSQKYSFPFDYSKIIEAFGWSSMKVDGHDLTQLSKNLSSLVKGASDQPIFVEAKTTKGMGVERFTSEHAWHRRTPSESEFNDILGELQ